MRQVLYHCANASGQLMHYLTMLQQVITVVKTRVLLHITNQAGQQGRQANKAGRLTISQACLLCIVPATSALVLLK